MGRELALALISAQLLAGIARAASDSGDRRDDRQVWSDLQVGVSIQGHWELELHGTMRLGRDVSRLMYDRFGVGVVYQPRRWFSLSPTYAYIAFREPSSAREHRFFFDGTLYATAGRWSFSDRNRVEYRIIDSEPSVRYRNRLQIEHPLHARAPGFRIFVSEEIHFDSRVDRWNRNRFAIGLIRNIGSSSAIEIYYLRQNDGFARPGDIHAVGVSLSLGL